MAQRIDWQFMQREYDSGKSHHDLIRDYGISKAGIAKAVKRGDFKSLSLKDSNQRRVRLKPNRQWTIQEKKAISIRVTQLFKDRPELHPNRKVANNRKKMTYPERLAYDWLTANKIAFIHNAKIDRYFVDFLVGRVAIEIDGERWHDPEYDSKRDAIIEASGIRIIRIKAVDIVHDRDNLILQQAINGHIDPEFVAGFVHRIEEQRKAKCLCTCGRPKWKSSDGCRKCRKGKPNIIWPSDIVEMVIKSSIGQVAIELDVSHRSVAKHLRVKFGYIPSADNNSFADWHAREKLNSDGSQRSHVAGPDNVLD